MQATSRAAANFWSRVTKTDTCWIWTGPLGRGGYGRAKFDGVTMYAHRFAYELLVGPIPEGLSLDHLCRARDCVNPEHLEPVTHRENCLRSAGPTAINAAKTHCIRGHEFTPENTIVRAGGSRNCRECHNEQHRSKRAAKALVREGRYVCPECGAGFDRPKGLAAHKGRRHPIETAVAS
jgi:hypothetical protein